MARGDGKATRGKTKSRSSEIPRYTKSGVRKMAYGGNPGDLAGGGFGTGNTGLSSSRSSPSSDNGFRDSSSVGSYGGSGQGGGGYSTGSSVGTGGSGQGGTGYRSSTSAAISAGSSGGSGSTSARISGVSAGSISASSRAGTSPANIAAGSGSAAMHAMMASDRVNYPTASEAAATRSATQAASLSSPTGMRGTTGSYQPSGIRAQVSPVAGYGATPAYSGAIDARTVQPGTVTFNQVPATVPFAKSIAGMSLLKKSKEPLTEEEARALAEQLPKGSKLIGTGLLSSAAYPKPAGYNPANYAEYPAQISGHAFNVSVPAGATGMGYRSVGQWNADSATPTSDFRGLPSPTRTSSGSGIINGPQFDTAASLHNIVARGLQPANVTANMEIPTRTVALGNVDGLNVDFPGYGDALMTAVVSTPLDTRNIVGTASRVPLGSTKQNYDRLTPAPDLGQPNLNPYAGRYQSSGSPSQVSTGPGFNSTGRGTYSGYANPQQAVSSGPGFNTYGRGSYPSAPSPAGSPLNTSNIVAAAAGALPEKGDGGIDEYLLRRRRRLLLAQRGGDGVTSGTSAMRHGGKANGLAQKGWTKGRMR